MLWFGDFATVRLPSPPASSRLKSVRILDFMNPYSVAISFFLRWVPVVVMPTGLLKCRLISCREVDADDRCDTSPGMEPPKHRPYRAAEP